VALPAMLCDTPKVTPILTMAVSTTALTAIAIRLTSELLEVIGYLLGGEWVSMNAIYLFTDRQLPTRLLSHHSL